MLSGHRGQRAAALFVFGAVLVLVAAGCAPTSTGAEGTPTGQATVLPSAPDDGPVVTDGPTDPGQSTQRSGPAVEFGGPPFGAQGDPVEISPGRWCASVGFFWGGDAAPQNVTFTVTGIESDPESAVVADPGVCGSIGVDQSCIGFVMTPDTPFSVCSMTLAATPSFGGRAAIGFVGTLECTAAEFCDAAISRSVEQGPPLVVGS